MLTAFTLLTFSIPWMPVYLFKRFFSILETTYSIDRQGIPFQSVFLNLGNNLGAKLINIDRVMLCIGLCADVRRLYHGSLWFFPLFNPVTPGRTSFLVAFVQVNNKKGVGWGKKPNGDHKALRQFGLQATYCNIPQIIHRHPPICKTNLSRICSKT